MHFSTIHNRGGSDAKPIIIHHCYTHTSNNDDLTQVSGAENK